MVNDSFLMCYTSLLGFIYIAKSVSQDECYYLHVVGYWWGI